MIVVGAAKLFYMIQTNRFAYIYVLKLMNVHYSFSSDYLAVHKYDIPKVNLIQTLKRFTTAGKRGYASDHLCSREQLMVAGLDRRTYLRILLCVIGLSFNFVCKLVYNKYITVQVHFITLLLQWTLFPIYNIYVRSRVNVYIEK